MKYWQFKNGSRIYFSPLEGGEEYRLKGISMKENKVHETFEIVAFGSTEEALAQLKSEYGNKVYDVTTFAGMADAKEARADIKKWRTGLEKVRKAEKSRYLEAGRTLDRKAREITAELVSLEEVPDTLIKAEESRKAEAKRIKDEAEKARIDKILGVISEITGLINVHYRSDSATIEEAILKMETYISSVNDGFFAEFTMQAKATIESSKSELVDLLDVVKKVEADKRRVQEEMLIIEEEKKAIAISKANEDAIMAAKEEELAKAQKAHNDAVKAKAEEDERINAEIAENRKKLAQEQEDATEAASLAEKAFDEFCPAVEEEDWVPKVYRLKKEVLKAILELCPPADNDVLWPEKRLERIEAICIANIGGK